MSEQMTWSGEGDQHRLASEGREYGAIVYLDGDYTGVFRSVEGYTCPVWRYSSVEEAKAIIENAVKGHLSFEEGWAKFVDANRENMHLSDLARVGQAHIQFRIESSESVFRGANEGI